MYGQVPWHVACVSHCYCIGRGRIWKTLAKDFEPGMKAYADSGPRMKHLWGDLIEYQNPRKTFMLHIEVISQGFFICDEASTEGSHCMSESSTKDSCYR